MRKPFYQAMRCYKLQITRITARSKHAQAVLSGDALLQITNYKNYSRSKHAQVVLSGDALLQITNYKNYSRSKHHQIASREARRPGGMRGGTCTCPPDWDELFYGEQIDMHEQTS